MVANSAIEWTHHTFNPWIGCTRVSLACDHCYAAVSTPARAMDVSWGPGEPRHRTAASTWKQPLAWDRKCGAAGIRQRVFCASLADVFDNEVDPAWRADLFDLIRATPNLDWLLLTKRIGNVVKMAEAAGGLPVNVWLGATVINQAEVDRDVPKLLAAPASVRFLSMEPLLDVVDLTEFLAPECWGDCACDSLAGYDPGCRRNGGDGTLTRKIDWVIVGGESGAEARPMHPDWARSLRDQCADAGVPFLFKQWGEWVPDVGAVDGWSIPDNPEVSRFPHRDWEGDHWGEPYERGWMDEVEPDTVSRIGKKLAGRMLDGVQHDGFPA